MTEIDDDHFEYDGGMRQCISGFGENTISDWLRNEAGVNDIQANCIANVGGMTTYHKNKVANLTAAADLIDKLASDNHRLRKQLLESTELLDRQLNGDDLSEAELAVQIEANEAALAASQEGAKDGQ